MKRFKSSGLIAIGVSMLAIGAIPVSIASSQAAPAPKARPPKPHVSTGGARRLAGSSAELTASVDPKGQATSYYFQWGITAAYGAQTATVSVGSGLTKLKVGQTITGLQQGVTYHFRAVAVYAVNGQNQTVAGRDRTFALKGQLKFEIPKIPPVTVGSPFILGGVLRGVGGARHPISLQASPYPYTSFTTIGVPGLTDASGRFAFRVAHLSSSTAFRVVALELRPLYSPVLTVSAAARVTLHVRAGAHAGLVRLYGTVTPAAIGASLSIQLRKPIKSRKPSKSEATTKFVNAFFTVVKKAGQSFSRFSVVVKVRQTGRYRAFVKVRSGAVVSGASQSVVLHAAPNSGAKTKRKR
jgi:hypothetical protein